MIIHVYLELLHVRCSNDKFRRFIVSIKIKAERWPDLIEYQLMIENVGHAINKKKRIYFLLDYNLYKKIGCNINVLQQTACLVVNPITVGSFAFLFRCTPVGRTSDSMKVPT